MDKFNIDHAWYQALNDCFRHGQLNAPRGIQTRELLGHTITVDMSQPILNLGHRNLGYHFLCAEAAWVLSGDNKLQSLMPYAPAISAMSDDGIFLSGAYGPPLIKQLSYVVDTLMKDPSSRQAVATIWQPNPSPSKDIPCTVSVQWLIRDSHIHTFVNMRSSDIWLGVPYDIFTFTMLTGAICLLIRERIGFMPKLGQLCNFAGSRHLYHNNVLAAQPFILADIEQLSRRFTGVEPFEPGRWQSWYHLVQHLEWLSNIDYNDREWLWFPGEHAQLQSLET